MKVAEEAGFTPVKEPRDISQAVARTWYVSCSFFPSSTISRSLIAMGKGYLLVPRLVTRAVVIRRLARARRLGLLAGFPRHAERVCEWEL